MTFLAPLTGILAGLAACGGVLAFYFLKLRRRPLRVSSTLLWTRAAQDLEVNTPFRWIRVNRLLLLQLLIAALLAAALGRPALPTGGVSADRLIILVDRSASMGVADADSGRKTRLQAALDRAGELLDRATAGGETQVVVASFAADATVHEGWSSAKGPLRRGLSEIELTDQPGDLAGALETLEALLLAEDSSEDRAPANVLILTDDAGGSAQSASARLTVESVGGSVAASNTGIVSIGARRDFERPNVVRVFARLATSKPGRSLVPVTLRVTTDDGERVVDRSAPALEASEESGGPSEASVSFEYDEPDEHVVTLELGNPDALEADNSASVVLPSLASPSIVLVRDRVDDDPQAWVVEDILRALEPESLRVLSTAGYLEDPEGITSDAELIVFDRCTGGLPPPAISSLALGCVLDRSGVSAEGETDATRVLTWDRDHPTLLNAGMDRLFVDRAIALRVASSDVPGVRRELARGNGGPLIVESETSELRRITVGFAPADSSWPLDVGFSLFIATAVERLTFAAASGDGLAVTSDRPVLIRSSATSFANGEGDELSGTPLAGTVDLGIARTVGVYRPLDGRPGELPVAVNLSSLQETLATVSRTEEAQDASSQVAADAGTIDSGPREIWYWFVLAAAAVVLAEWAVYIASNRSLVGGPTTARARGTA